MGIAKVTLNNETLMDITDDTVTASGLMLGDTAHGANGESVTGTYVPVTYDVATETTDGLMSASDKVKLNGVATGAEVNQNAFSNVKVGTTTIAADSKTDTLTLTAGTNITLTPNATSDSVTIAVNGMPSKVSDLDNDSGFITSSGTAANVSGTVAIEHGGTGATSASAARTNLGLGSAATASTSSSVGNNSNLPTGAAIQSYVTGLGYTSNTGTVTSIATGAGLTGGTITGSGTIKADLKSETKSSLTAASKGSTTNREYAVGLDANGDLSVNVPWENTQTITGVKGSSESSYRTGNVSISATNIGLGNVENKSSATIRGELTKSNVTTALGFTPYTQDEVNALVSSVFTYKGTKSTYAQVSALTGMKTGDVWQVTADNSEYVYNGSAWEKLGPTIDLSGYLTSVSVAGQSLTPGSNSITAEQLKTALGLGSAAYASTASSVGNNTNLPTGAAVQSYVTGLGYTTNTGTVTKVTAGTGLTGGDITTSGTIALKGQNIYYATCPTAAATAAKVATTTNGDFELTTGAMVRVKFTYADTYNGTSTLNVDSKGAKNIVNVGTTAKARYHWSAGEVVDFVYDGTNFTMSDTGVATTTYYGITKLSSATNSTSTALAATPSAVKAAYDLAAAAAPQETTYTKDEVQSYVTGLGYTSNTGTVTSVATGTGLTGGPITTTGTISLEGGVVTAGSAGPTAAVTGNEGNTVAIPRITVDEYGRVTGLTSYNLTNKNTTYTAATTAPGNVASSSAVGTSTNYARQDHTHGIALAIGDSNGQVKIAGTNVSVKGWNTAATYDIESTLANDSKLPTGSAVTAAINNAVDFGTVGSNQNPVYFNDGDPTPGAFTWGVDEDQHVQVGWDGDAPEIVIPTTSALAISSGGTGATTAAGARTNLGLGSAATYNVVSSVQDDSNLVTNGAVKRYVDNVNTTITNETIPNQINAYDGSTSVTSHDISGTVLSFTATKAQPVKSMVLNLEPTQSGSEYDSVNVVRSGKNLLDLPTSGGRTNSGITWTYNADGTVTASGTATGNSWSYATPTVLMLPKGTYTSSVSSPFGLVVGIDGTYVYNGSNNTYTFTLDEKKAVTVNVRVASGSTVNATTGIMLEVGSTATAYESPSVTTYPISLSSEGIVYGGSLDVTSEVTTLLGDNTIWMDAEGTMELTYEDVVSSIKYTEVGELGTAATHNASDTVVPDGSLPTGVAVYNHTANRTFFGTCSTAAATAAKVITLSDADDFKLVPGVVIGVKSTVTNTASNVTLNVNGTGGKSVWYNTAVHTGSTAGLYGTANLVIYYMYDGEHWVFLNNSSNYANNSNTVPAAQCETAAATAAKAATITNYTLTANTYLHFNIIYANTVAGAITMNVNSKGAKSIYINGTASSSSNHTLPAGTYIAFYDGTNWYFNTDGTLPGLKTDPTCTASNGATIVDTYTTLDRYNNLVMGTLCIKAPSSVTADVIAGTISPVPKSAQYFNGAATWAFTSNIMIRIETNGNIRLSGSSWTANAQYIIPISYLTS